MNEGQVTGTRMAITIGLHLRGSTIGLLFAAIGTLRTRGLSDGIAIMTTDGKSHQTIIEERGAGGIGVGVGAEVTVVREVTLEMRGHVAGGQGRLGIETTATVLVMRGLRMMRGKMRKRWIELGLSLLRLSISATFLITQLKVRIAMRIAIYSSSLSSASSWPLAVDLYSFIWERFTVVDESRAFSFRLGRDEATGRTKGSAFIDFEHLEASKAFVELCDGQGLFFPKKPFINPDPNPGYPPAQLSAGAGGAEDFIRLRVEFSQNLPRPQNEVVPATSNKVPVLDDWLCLACNVLNFARRHECFQCSAPRMPDSQVVKSDRGPMKRPTSCLCIQGSALASIDEDRIRRLFSGQAAVTDVRLIRDKRNKAGVIAYVRYGSVAEAARALSLLQGVVPSGSSSGLNLAFSRDVFKGESSGLESNHSLRQAADATNTWQPKEFGSDDGGGGGGWEPKAFNEAKDEEPQATVVKAESSQATSSGFVLDPASGYYYDAKSGYYYDPKTSLYYHSSTKHWYQFNQSTGEYKAVTTQASTTSASAPSTTYAPNPDPTPAPKASEQVAAEKVAVPAEPSAPVTKKASAVIGAAPQLNPGGLLLAAIQMDEKAKAKLKMESAPVPVPSAPIQGVIHKGKWANKKKQEAGVKD